MEPPSSVCIPSIHFNTESRQQGIDSLRPLHGSIGSTLTTQEWFPDFICFCGGALKTAKNLEPSGTAQCQEVLYHQGR